MAYSTLKATVGQTLAEGTQLTTGSANVSGLLPAVDSAAVAAAIAVLVADAASPTQAHVTTLNTAWGTLLTNSVAQGDAVLLVNPATVLTTSVLKRIFERFVRHALGGYFGLTP